MSPSQERTIRKAIDLIHGFAPRNRRSEIEVKYQRAVDALHDLIDAYATPTAAKIEQEITP